MAQQLVRAGDAEFYVELTDTGGPAPIRAGEVLSFDGVRSAIEGIATDLAKTWDKVKPDEASVEFALKLTARSGRLTCLLVEGGGEASLTVTLAWKQPSAAQG